MSYYQSSTTTPTPLCQSDIIMEIERFVKYIMKCDLNAVLSLPDVEAWYLNYLQVMLPRFLSVYSPRHDYSEHIDAFWVGCDAAGLLQEHAHFGDVHYSISQLSRNSAGLLVQAIVHYTKTLNFSRVAGDRFYQTQKKNEGLNLYVESVLNRYARTLVVRVDLKYLSALKHLVGIDEVFDHRDTFKRLMANHPVFAHLTGYVWTNEQGSREGGYHIHCTFFFNGHERRAGPHIGQQIGELWAFTTDGMGSYFNCNSAEHTRSYIENGTLGVNMISRKDPIACANCLKMVGYLAEPLKDDQYLRIKPRGRRSFIRGSTP